VQCGEEVRFSTPGEFAAAAEAYPETQNLFDGSPNLGEQPEILIDACQREDGLWFDGGELGQLVKQLAKEPVGKPDSQHQVIAFLGEVFKARE